MYKCYFTKFGEVYSGEEWNQLQHNNHIFLIQRSKLNDFKAVYDMKMSFEEVKKYGYVLKKESIAFSMNEDDIPEPVLGSNGDTMNSGHDRSVMFIFGAGASAHCVHRSDATAFYNDELSPPIGPDLFAKKFRGIYKKYNGVKQALHSLQDNGGADVESLLEEEWHNIQAENNQEVLSRHINIQYYLQELLSKVSSRVLEEYDEKNLYAALADKLQKTRAASQGSSAYGKNIKRYAFVSFNQDCILENFLSRYFRKPITTIDDYANINESPFSIFKPHGSSNWGWKFLQKNLIEGDTSSWLFDNNINYYQLYFKLLGNHTSMVDWSSWGRVTGMNKYNLGKYPVNMNKIEIIGNNSAQEYFPALLLPYRDKDEFAMPVKHFDNLNHYLHYVETLVIIGWKGNEDAFNKLLLKSADKIKKVIIADPNAKIVSENIGEFLSQKSIQPVYYDSFEHFVLSGIDKVLY
jgi:hypothetical protein